jgi:hypothetical protein
VQNLNPE